ncbi:unnamed protein product [Penicillium olsonii]|uniref:Myb-like domain-containing protein n=1 Tax=Penicillium olsonii TaxID=99116 RepID=A0A9W4IJ81_PENOL|nr:unnamed protein product [Penicillium olsonii]CAG8296955.1 unnamed protein product [Penicillium olsonii]
MKVMDHLPFIQAQATLVMNVLIPPSLSPDSILAEAKKLRDSAHPNTKRLNRSIQGLTDEIQDSPLATEGDILIDISHFRPGISPPQLEASISDVHMTNCASLAFVMFCQSTGEPHSQAIENLDDLFPLCLMENIAHNPESRKIGTSVTQDTTFSLALSIRTQFFIIEIERRQQELNFNPVSILRQIFCKDLTPSEDNHENPGSFRGFKLPGVFEDEEGHLPDALPEKLRQSVSDRFSDLYEEISEWDGVDVDGLKKAYKWRAFERDLARWIHARSREIREDIRRVSDKLTQSSSPARRYTPLSVGPPARHTPARTPVVANSTPQKQNLANVPHAASQAASINSPPAPSPQRVPATSPRPPAPSPQKAPIRVSFDEAESPVVNNQTSRKPHGNNFRDQFSFEFLKKKRLGTSRPQPLSVATSHPPNHLSNGSTATGAVNGGDNADSREVRESPDLGDLDDITYVNNDDDLVFGNDNEITASTSPTASARINRVSHNPNQYKNMSHDQEPRPSIEQSGIGGGSTVPRRSFIDQQNGAGRVSPINYNETGSAEKPRAGPSLPNPRKRPVSRSSSEESDGYERDDRDNNRRTEKRPRLQVTPGNGAGSSLGSTHQPTWIISGPEQEDRPRHIRTDSGELTDGETTNRPLPAVFRQQSNPVVQRSPSSRHGRAIGRGGRWSAEEDAHFMELMKEHGLGWAAIKQADERYGSSRGGPPLFLRTQINLKDRHRCLVAKFEHEGKPVPEFMVRPEKT